MNINQLIQDILSNDIEVIVKKIDGELNYLLDGFVNYDKIIIFPLECDGKYKFNITDYYTGHIIGTVETFDGLLQLYYSTWKSTNRAALPKEQWYNTLLNNKYLFTAINYEYL